MERKQLIAREREGGPSRKLEAIINGSGSRRRLEGRNDFGCRRSSRQRQRAPIICLAPPACPWPCCVVRPWPRPPAPDAARALRAPPCRAAACVAVYGARLPILIAAAAVAGPQGAHFGATGGPPGFGPRIWCAPEMEDFANILHRDYGLKPGGKSAPMAGASGGHTRAGSSGATLGRSGSAPRMPAADDVFGSSVFNSPRVNGGGVRCVCGRCLGVALECVFGCGWLVGLRTVC